MKKFFSLLLILGGLTLITSSCGSNKNLFSLSSIDGEWNILKVNGDTVKSESNPFIGFNISEKSVYGNSGCNSFSGEVVQKPSLTNSISFNNVATTQMFCHDMQIEKAILESLNATRSFTKGLNGNIILLNGDGAEVLVLSKR